MDEKFHNLQLVDGQKLSQPSCRWRKKEGEVLHREK
jgi:hypothetical protein